MGVETAQPPPPQSLPTPPSLPANSGYTAYWCEENVYLLAKACLKDERIRATWDVYAVFISNERKTVALWCQNVPENDAFVVWDYHVVLVLRAKSHRDSTTSAVKPNHSSHQVKVGKEVADDSGKMLLNESGRKDETPSIQSWVYDYDTWLEKPCSWKVYIDATFPYRLQKRSDEVYSFKEEYISKLRVVPGDELIAEFASDRSHMLTEVNSEVGPEQTSGRDKNQSLTYNAPPPAYACIQGRKAAEKGVKNNIMIDFVNMNGSSGIGRVMSLDEACAFFSK